MKNIRLGKFELTVCESCMHVHPRGWVEPGPTLELGDHTVVLWDALAVERRCADDEAVDICHGPSFFVVLLIGLNECNCQDLPPQVVEELLQVHGIAVGGLARA